MREEWWLLHAAPVSPGTPSEGSAVPHHHHGLSACQVSDNQRRFMLQIMMCFRVALASKSTLDLLAGKTDMRQEKRQGCGLSQSQLHVSAVPCRKRGAP